MLSKELLNKSKFISYALRHKPEEVGLKLDKDGFVDISDLIKSYFNKTKDNLTEDDIDTIISNSDKKRFEIVGNKIRAMYGHSVETKIQYKEGVPPIQLYHGTSHKVLNSILKSGLKKMDRQYVHLSSTIDMARLVGSRRDKTPVILLVDSKSMYNDGIKFYIGNDNVWLCDYVDPRYISILN